VSGNRDRDAEARQELAAALEDAIGPHVSGGLRIEEIVDAVWPVVERIRERARAEVAAKVRDLADRLDDPEVPLPPRGKWTDWFRDAVADVASEDAG
jgi:hypothetical protein